MNNMPTRRGPAQTRRKEALRGLPTGVTDPTHPRVVSAGADTTHVRADLSQQAGGGRTGKRASIKNGTALWGALMEGQAAIIGGHRYVCLGWAPVPGNMFAVTAVASVWGHCRVCNEGFQAFVSHKNIKNAYAPRTCLAHRKRAKQHDAAALPCRRAVGVGQ